MRLLEFSVAELQVLAAAYAYEVLDSPIMSDRTFDLLAQSIEHSISSKVGEFNPSTGQWIHEIVDGNEDEWEEFVRYCSIKAVEGAGQTHLHHPDVERYLKDVFGWKEEEETIKVSKPRKVIRKTKRVQINRRGELKSSNPPTSRKTGLFF